MTTVLTMTTLINSVNAALPKISYMKSIDIYLFVCFFMVFGAMVEYACVGYTDKRIQLRKNRFEAMKKVMEEKRQEVAKQMEMQARVDHGIFTKGKVNQNLARIESKRTSCGNPIPVKWVSYWHLPPVFPLYL